MNHQKKLMEYLHLTKLAELNSAPPRIKETCAKIDPAYTASRYPDAAVHYSKDECEEILTDADEVFKWIKEKLD